MAAECRVVRETRTAGSGVAEAGTHSLRASSGHSHRVQAAAVSRRCCRWSVQDITGEVQQLCCRDKMCTRWVPCCWGCMKICLCKQRNRWRCTKHNVIVLDKSCAGQFKLVNPSSQLGPRLLVLWRLLLLLLHRHKHIIVCAAPKQVHRLQALGAQLLCIGDDVLQPTPGGAVHMQRALEHVLCRHGHLWLACIGGAQIAQQLAAAAAHMGNSNTRHKDKPATAAASVRRKCGLCACSMQGAWLDQTGGDPPPQVPGRDMRCKYSSKLLEPSMMPGKKGSMSLHEHGDITGEGRRINSQVRHAMLCAINHRVRAAKCAASGNGCPRTSCCPAAPAPRPCGESLRPAAPHVRPAASLITGRMCMQGSVSPRLTQGDGHSKLLLVSLEKQALTDLYVQCARPGLPP